MKIRKIATITVLVLSSFAANNVAPSKSELEGMYDKAFREFDASNYAEALKGLDAIDARQPDLAESQNLRGVILMRQKDYEKAEKALQRALAADPKFWNARFNLAEIPFLQKNWEEARKRFQELLNGNASELQGEASQLIQYKILITYLMEGKKDMVDSMIAKFELAPETPAVNYARAAIALNGKDEAAAKNSLTIAEKAFSPQLNKLFAESLYEVGWLEKPAGQSRAALELNSAAERAAKTKAFAKAKYDEAEQALSQRDYTAARKFIDDADAADPNQAAVVNLRGEILLEQKEFDQAETEFRKAAKLDPKLRDAQYNLAQVPFKKKEFTKARERFEELFATTSGADKDRAAQLIKYKVYLTYLLEGKDARAQKMMEQFQFTGDTPALYYAQAAWEFQHSNPAKANDWVTSARKIYPSALNGLFADAFFDLGWLRSAEATASTNVAETSPTEGTAPAIEPTPLPAISLAKNEPAKFADPLTLAAKSDPVIPGMEATTANAAQSPGASSAIVSASASPSVETPVASTASPAAAMAVVASPAPEPEQQSVIAAAAAASSPVTALAPAKVREWSEPSWTERLGDLQVSPLIMGTLVLVALALLGWVLIPLLRRRTVKHSSARQFASAGGPPLDEVEGVGDVEELVSASHLSGAPPQVSLQLRASEPALRRAAMPLAKNGRQFGNGNGIGYGHGNGHSNDFGNGHATATAPAAPAALAPALEAFAPAETSFEEGVGETQPNETETTGFEAPAFAEPVSAEMETLTNDEPAVSAFSEVAPAYRDTFASADVATQEFSAPVMAETENVFEAKAFAPETETVIEAPQIAEGDSEPVDQGQPVPYLAPVSGEEEPVVEMTTPEQPAVIEELAGAALAVTALAGTDALRHSSEPLAAASGVVEEEPAAQQSTTSTMPTPTQPTPSPVIRTGSTPPMGGTAPQNVGGPQPQGAGGGMHTAVQLTFSTEIASLQLTPSFKMGSMQLKPTSRIVTMRLAPSQNPQPMNLQVTFEVASVQLTGNALSVVRLTPSQQQRPGVATSPSFNIAGLQMLSGSEAAPFQLTPSSQQGQASVHVTGAFQIATVEFSPSFEIASIILNSTSRNVTVQLPGAGPSAPESAPVFEITNVQLAGSGEISLMHLNPPGVKRA